MRRSIVPALLTAAVLCSAAPASAQPAVNFFLGGFVPAPMDARGSDDVIYQNSAFLTSVYGNTPGIDMSEFHGFTFGGEVLIPLSRLFEAGVGVSYYQRSVPTVYTELVNNDGTEIAQELKLRIVPFSATFRFLPLGSRGPIQPYVGGGVGVLIYRYSETGQFVDFSNNVFVDTFTASGAVAGPTILGGVRAQAGNALFGGELRWQSGTADLPADQGFAGPRLNLGGFNYLFTVGFKF